MAEKEKLGIFVPTNKHIDHLIGITRAAKKAGKAVAIFFTHNGILMTQDSRYQELVEIGPEEIALCNVRWEELGLKDKPVPAGMGHEDFATQFRHCAMIQACDRYLVI